MASVILEGRVRHQRRAPKRHRFAYSLFMVGLDLSELDTVFRRHWLWSTRRPALARFRRSDHLGDPDRPLDECVRDLVEEHTGRRPAGKILLVTNLRYYGYIMNPVSFYLVHDEQERVSTIVADVSNTPWNERHPYVLECEDPDATIHRFRFAKDFHVSPFMPMAIDYDWSFRWDGQSLYVHMKNFEDGAAIFDATLRMKARPIRARTLAWSLLRFPHMTAMVVVGIYWQAFRLWRKRVPFHPHPKHDKSEEVLV